MALIAIIYGTLFMTSILYAALLARTRGIGIEPDYTWLEVVVGCGLCLLAAADYIALAHPTAWQAFFAVCGAFVVGGLPIVAWQIGQAIKRRHDALRTQQRLVALRVRRRESGTTQTQDVAAGGSSGH